MINLIELDTDKSVNSAFGWRNSPTEGASTSHKGIDITLSDYNIPSVLGGTVSYVGYSNSGGNMIFVKQNDGTTAKYMHMAAPSTLKVGDVVSEGTILGTQGSTGISTGDHVHFQVEKDGVPIDPETYFSSSVVVEEKESNGGIISDILGKIVTAIVILLLAVLAVYLFMKAFDIQII